MTTEPKDQALTREDIQRLEAMFHQSAQEMYVLVHLIELGLFGLYQKTKDYKALVKLHGKTRADEIVRTTVHDQLFNHDEQYNCGIILRKANELKTWLDRLFNVGIEVHKSVPDAASKEWQMAESLLADGKTLAYRHALQCCIDPKDDIKVDSTLRALAKHDTISERIMGQLRQE